MGNFMGVHVTCALVCDGCERRHDWSQECVPNAGGRTKVGNMTKDLRAEAKKFGWKRHGKQDFCPACAWRSRQISLSAEVASGPAGLLRPAGQGRRSKHA